MDKLLELIGAIFIFAALAMAFVTFNDASRFEVAVVAALTWSGPVFLSGLLLAALGNGLGHLKAIRTASEAQAEFFKNQKA